MGIPIVYFRSSSFNTHRTCPMQFYMEYTLGLRGLGGKKADKGTITHKILEITALCKKAEQDGIKIIDDEDIGEVFTDNYEPEYLNAIGARVYEYYTKNLFTYHTGKNAWRDRDFEDCLSWAWKALKFKDGMYDPRKRDVVDAEPHFDFEIKKDWAKYDYPEYNLSGHLALKGTIDLVADLGDGVYEVIDWKTGQRKDWATGKEYNQNNLFTNPQLRMYHYACKHLYPEANTFLMSIYFINTGGPFTVHFQDSDLNQTEDILAKRFEEIKNTDEPAILPRIRPKDRWKCRTMCDAGKTTFEGTNIEPIKEHRPGQRTRYGEVMTKCEQVRYMIKLKGIDWVTRHYMAPGYTIGKYGSGGGKVQD